MEFERSLKRWALTLWNCKEHYERNGILMRTLHAVVHITYGQIEGVEFVLTSSDRHGCFITPEDHRDEHSSMR